MTSRSAVSNQHSVTVRVDRATLVGDLAVPHDARGLVIFAHGSGSSRLSPRNRLVAAELQEAQFATLLLDLLTHDEEQWDSRTGLLRFDIEFLATRLYGATTWAMTGGVSRELPIGYFGASTGAGAALVAAARAPEAIRAVVSRGGRPDLAGIALAEVRAPTLLIVGSRDDPVITMNRDAMARMHARTELVIIPGATHLFQEPGTLEEVAGLARGWFNRFLPRETDDEEDR